MVIIAAVAGTDTDAAIVSEAMALADAFDDEVHAIHVRTYDSLSDEEKADSREKSVKERAFDVASAATADYNQPTVPVGLIGQPAAEILEYAADVETRYIVIGGQKRSPVGKALFGSKTQQILLGATQPVVTVMGPDKA